MIIETSRWSIDVGWASTWVKIVNEWFAATIYCKCVHVFAYSLVKKYQDALSCPGFFDLRRKATLQNMPLIEIRCMRIKEL